MANDVFDVTKDIPTTVFVPPYQESSANTWLRAVGGFCDGAQSVKRLGDLYSLRIGNMVFVEGNCDVDTVLPVAPRLTSFITVVDNTTSTLNQVKINSGSKIIETTLTNYKINGNYLADIQRN